MSNKELTIKEQSITASIIISGDLSKLNEESKVAYYRGYCERLGLDAFTKPFEILRLSGKETLYLTRSGAQQLNKMHQVSHQITSRNIHDAAAIYEVIARASLPDGRHTESIGAVNIANLKGEAYCNALMKAETKAKRRATLDLLGLGVLDETEVASMQERVDINVGDPAHPSIFVYGTIEAIQAAVFQCSTIEELNILYTNNKGFIEKNKIRDMFSIRKKALIL